MEEIWKEIPGYEGLYQISSLGKIKSLNRIIVNCKGVKKRIPEKLLAICKHKQGHHVVRLWKNNATKLFNLYRLLAIVFIPNPENKKEVNHINGDRISWPVLENLEWATPSENMKHAFKTGLSKGTYEKGFAHKLCKVKEPESLEIKRLRKEGISTMDISKKFNISQRHVYTICKL